MLDFKAILKGQEELLKTLEEIPERIQNRVFRFAGRKAARAVAERARMLTPRANKDSKNGLGHLQDRFTSVQRVYRSSGTTVFIVGSESGAKNRINHLVEFGTNQRWTGHKTRRTSQAGGTYLRNRKVKTASGGYRTIKEVARKRDKRLSAGSIRRMGYGNVPIAMAYRGRMPAFHQLGRAWKEVPVDQILTTEITKGLQRIADRSSASE